MDYLAVYGSAGMITWFICENITDWLIWLGMAMVLHFCLASRLHFELKMRRKKLMKKYYQGRGR